MDSLRIKELESHCYLHLSNIAERAADNPELGAEDKKTLIASLRLLHDIKKLGEPKKTESLRVEIGLFLESTHRSEIYRFKNKLEAILNPSVPPLSPPCPKKPGGKRRNRGYG